MCDLPSRVSGTKRHLLPWNLGSFWSGDWLDGLLFRERSGRGSRGFWVFTHGGRSEGAGRSWCTGCLKEMKRGPAGVAGGVILFALKQIMFCSVFSGQIRSDLIIIYQLNVLNQRGCQPDKHDKHHLEQRNYVVHAACILSLGCLVFHLSSCLQLPGSLTTGFLDIG